MDFRYRLAESNGGLIGLIGMRDNPHLHHLFIASTFQGQGLGRRLWELEKTESMQAGTRVFTVNASLDAISVYERFGFTVTAPAQDVGAVRFVPMEMVVG